MKRRINRTLRSSATYRNRCYVYEQDTRIEYDTIDVRVSQQSDSPVTSDRYYVQLDTSAPETTLLWAKQTGRDATIYAVSVEQGCQCEGYKRWQSCKHYEVTADLITNGLICLPMVCQSR